MKKVRMETTQDLFEKNCNLLYRKRTGRVSGTVLPQVHTDVYCYDTILHPGLFMFTENPNRK